MNNFNKSYFVDFFVVGFNLLDEISDGVLKFLAINFFLVSRWTLETIYVGVGFD